MLFIVLTTKIINLFFKVDFLTLEDQEWDDLLIFMTVKKIFLIYPEAIFGEGSGTPLQYSCLENPMDGGAW